MRGWGLGGPRLAGIAERLRWLRAGPSRPAPGSGWAERHLAGQTTEAAGRRHAGVYCNNDALEKAVIATGKLTGNMVQPVSLIYRFLCYSLKFFDFASQRSSSLGPTAALLPRCGSSGRVSLLFYLSSET